MECLNTHSKTPTPICSQWSMSRCTTVKEAAVAADTSSRRRQLYMVTSTTPTPEGVSGKAVASSGIMVKKIPCIRGILTPKAAARDTVHTLSTPQMRPVRTMSTPHWLEGGPIAWGKGVIYLWPRVELGGGQHNLGQNTGKEKGLSPAGNAHTKP